MILAHKRLFVFIVIIMLVALFFSGKGLAGRKIRGFNDTGNPMAVAWTAYDRMDYGWPLTMIRKFELDNADTAEGRIDYIGLAIDALFFAFIVLAAYGMIWYIVLKLEQPTKHAP